MKKEQQVAEATAQEAPATDAQPVTGGVLKRPVFIGVRPEDRHIIEKLESELGDEYEIAVMSPKITSQSEQVWLMSKFSEKERENMMNIKKDEHHRSQAFIMAEELDRYFNHSEQFPNGEFRHYNVKNYFRDARAYFTGGEKKNSGVSNRDVRNIIDMLALHGFIISMNPADNYDKRIFKIALDDSNQVLILQNQIIKHQNEKAAIDLLIQATEQQLAEVSARIQGEADALIPEPPAETIAEPQTKGKRKATKVKTEEAQTGENGTTDGTSTAKPKRSRSKRSDSESA